jgi:multicomponent Na+:H+ antiporter subunit F
MDLLDIYLFITVMVFFAGFMYFLAAKDLTEKVLAIDFMSLISASIMAIYSVRMNNSLYLDIIMVWALVNFLGTVAFSFYINASQNGAHKREGADS